MRSKAPTATAICSLTTNRCPSHAECRTAGYTHIELTEGSGIFATRLSLGEETDDKVDVFFGNDVVWIGASRLAIAERVSRLGEHAPQHEVEVEDLTDKVARIANVKHEARLAGIARSM